MKTFKRIAQLLVLVVGVTIASSAFSALAPNAERKITSRDDRCHATWVVSIDGTTARVEIFIKSLVNTDILWVYWGVNGITEDIRDVSNDPRFNQSSRVFAHTVEVPAYSSSGFLYVLAYLWVSYWNPEEAGYTEQVIYLQPIELSVKEQQ